MTQTPQPTQPHNHPMRTTPQSHAAALAYLVSRNALAKLAEPVLVLFANPHHGQAWRLRRDRLTQAMHHAPVSLWSVPTGIHNH